MEPTADAVALGLVWYAAFLFSLTVHEAAHALAALKQTYRGDMGWSTREELLELVHSSGVDPRRVIR